MLNLYIIFIFLKFVILKILLVYNGTELCWTMLAGLDTFTFIQKNSKNSKKGKQRKKEKTWKKNDFEILKSGFEIDCEMLKSISKPDFEILISIVFPFFLFVPFCFLFWSTQVAEEGVCGSRGPAVVTLLVTLVGDDIGSLKK